jgi:acyl-coenzyme A synthetase/AMP-(fatty) acid ligase
MVNGASMVIMPRWETKGFLQCVQDYRIATTHLVPTMFVRLLELKEQGQAGADLTSLHYVLHGAAPITHSVKRRMIDWWGPILTEYWGATESGVITLVDSEAWGTRPGTVGRAITNFQVFVGDIHGNPTGETEGMLYCRHRQLEQVFSYHLDPEKTAKAHPQPHVFCIGDIGRVDADGYVYLTDRESHMIICGGVNIYPSEVEQALMEHEDIVDTAVFGIPNEEWGEEVKAVVQLRVGILPSTEMAERIRQFASEKIARFKVPRSITFVTELPRNHTGKVLIRQLKENYKNTDLH